MPHPRDVVVTCIKRDASAGCDTSTATVTPTQTPSEFEFEFEFEPELLPCAAFPSSLRFTPASPPITLQDVCTRQVAFSPPP